MSKENRVERRKGPDFWHKLLKYATIVAWLSLLASMITLQYARPELLPGYAKYRGLSHLYRLEWDVFASNLLFYQLLLCSVLSLLAITINSQRLRRSDDHLHFNLILLLLVSTIAGLMIAIKVL